MLKRLCVLLAAPHPSFQDIERKRQSQLLASMALFVILFQILALPLSFFTQYTATDVQSNLSGLFMALIVYFLNRRGYYNIAAYLLVGLGFLIVHLALVDSTPILIFYVGLLLIISSILLPMKITVSLFFISIILQLGFVFVAPRNFMVDSLDALVFLLFTFPFILVFVIQRLTIEREQKVELQTAFDALQESEARWRSLVTTAPNMVALIQPDYTFSFINRSPEDFTPEQLAQRSILDIILPEYRDIAKKHFQEAFESQIPVQFEVMAIDLEGEAQWYSVVANAIRDNGEDIKLLVMSQNITQIKESEQHLIDEHNLLRTLIDSIPDSIYIKDTAGHFLLNNRTSMRKLGIKHQDELIGKTDFDLFSKDLASQFRKHEEEALQSEQSFLDYEEPLIDLKKGVIGQVLTSIVPARNELGEATHIIGISRNITKQKEIEKQQLELSVHRERIKVLEEVISDISHDIKTPLASIKTAVYILQNHPEKREKYLKQLDTQVDRLTKLVEDVLAMARLDKKAYFTFHSSTLSALNRSIEYIIKDFEARLTEKNITLSRNLSDSEKQIIINETELGRAITNLIENAVNYTPKGGSIEVETTVQEKQFIIRVSDTGIGIDEDDQPLIFNRFYRADKARTNNYGGTGLGLAITQRIIEIHDGRIELQSEIGVGSTFTIYLPVVFDEQD